ncbi:MAG: DUF3293 domain-containing protein [Chromatiales bacterium]|nr:DUF3293 domain-containing protein [Chromatiales bacterium]
MQLVHISDALTAAYESTDYQVSVNGTTQILRVGETLCTPLSAIGSTIAVVTAFNPFSQTLAALENERRHRLLVEDVVNRGYTALPAVGVAAKGRWSGEQSLAVVQPDVKVLDEWMVAFQQNAVFLVSSDQPGRLLMHPNEERRHCVDPDAISSAIERLESDGTRLASVINREKYP